MVTMRKRGVGEKVMIVGELFDKSRAVTIVGDLRKKGIQAELQVVSHEGNSLYQIIVQNEDDGEKAREIFRIYIGLPGAPPEPDPEWMKIKSIPLGIVTKFILLFSGVVFLTSFNKEAFRRVCDLFFFNRPNGPLFSSLLQGEFWRLITPIFLHFGFMHILFNSLWFKDLGSLLEKIKGRTHYIFFILISATLSNTLQYIAMGRPEFGGLSGVVYALLGFVWVNGHLNEGSEFKLPKRDIVLMVGWYVMCLSGLIGNIANVAHGVGLAIGMVWGQLPWRPHLLKLRIKYLLLALLFSFGTYLIEIMKTNLIQELTI